MAAHMLSLSLSLCIKCLMIGKSIPMHTLNITVKVILKTIPLVINNLAWVQNKSNVDPLQLFRGETKWKRRSVRHAMKTVYSPVLSLFLHSSQSLWKQPHVSFVLHPSFSVQAPWLSRVGAFFVSHGWGTWLRMDHICEGLVQALACGWTTSRVWALRRQWWGVAWGKCVVSL